MGKTRLLRRPGADTRKHPHARGEDSYRSVCRLTNSETPPRTWGRPVDDFSPEDIDRNTPTHVGKTMKKVMLVRVI